MILAVFFKPIPMVQLLRQSVRWLTCYSLFSASKESRLGKYFAFCRPTEPRIEKLPLTLLVALDELYNFGFGSIFR
jgi:hypothetical protein